MLKLVFAKFKAQFKLTVFHVYDFIRKYLKILNEFNEMMPRSHLNILLFAKTYPEVETVGR